MDGEWLEGDLHAEHEKMLANPLTVSTFGSRLHPSRKLSKQESCPHQHQHRPPHSRLSHTRSFTAVRTPDSPHRRSSGDGGRARLGQSSRPSTSGQEPTMPSLAEVIDSGACALSLTLNNTLLGSMLDETALAGMGGEPSLEWISSLYASVKRQDRTNPLLGPQGTDEDGRQTSLLLDALTRAGLGRAPARDFSRRGSRLLNSRHSSANFLAAVRRLSKGTNTDGSVCGDGAGSMSASGASQSKQSPSAALDTGDVLCGVGTCAGFLSCILSLDWCMPHCSAAYFLSDGCMPARPPAHWNELGGRECAGYW